MNILIAEDDNLIATSLKKNFLEEGHNAIVAGDGERALDLMKHIEFDIILLDWRMPKMDGLTVCNHIRSAGSTVPIILITALSDISKKIEALNQGADDYITKPFSFLEVMARINAVMRRVEGNVDKLYFDGLSLDLFSHTIFGTDKSVKLTEKEFELLRYFIKHRGAIISKETLAQEVWNLSEIPTSNVIEATVKNLRKKFEEYFSKNLIKNVYGEGYSFIL